jgi:hypothetical protein
MSAEAYGNIREVLGDLIGARVIDISQHDPEELKDGGNGYVVLMFDNGHTLQCPITNVQDGGDSLVLRRWQGP